MALLIDKGVPVPPATTERGEARIALNVMGVGDSFAVPLADRKRTLSAVNHMRQVLPDRRYVTRTLETEFRVWRTA